MAHSNITEARFRALMLETGQLAQDVGSVVYGREAVSCGLIDQLGTLSDALAYLHGEIEREKREKPD